MRECPASAGPTRFPRWTGVVLARSPRIVDESNTRPSRVFDATLSKNLPARRVSGRHAVGSATVRRLLCKRPGATTMFQTVATELLRMGAGASDAGALDWLVAAVMSRALWPAMRHALTPQRPLARSSAS
jgi:hypothetical protein